MNGLLLAAALGSGSLSPTQFDPAPDTNSSNWPWLVALPCIVFALWLAADALMLWFRKRSRHRTLIITNELYIVEHPTDASHSPSDDNRGRDS
jgi:hypothetical protein